MLKDSLQDCVKVVLVCLKCMWDVWILKPWVHQGSASGKVSTLFSDLVGVRYEL